MRFLLQLIAGSMLTVSPAVTVVACNTSNNTTADISSGVNIGDISIAANTDATYADLNNNSDLIGTISSAIDSAKNVAVTVNHDYIISNDQVANIKQAVGATVKFVVTAVGDQIKGNFDFLVTLSKTDISKNVVVNDPMTSVNLNQTYGNLNNDANIIGLIIKAIKQSKGIDVEEGTDFIITNNQPSGTKQSVGTAVTFTVTGTGRKVTGSFSFIDTLGKVDISNGITITDLQTSADIGAVYAALNTDSIILNTIVKAINTAKNTNITSDNITLTNDQKGNQVVGQSVTFTVTGNGSQVTGSFSFVATLTIPDISTGVSVSDLMTPANPAMTYSAMNNYNGITSKVAQAINAAKNTSVTGSDFTITNNQTGNQVAGTPVTFTVSANTTNKIKGSFSFINTLGKVNISNGVIITDPKTKLNTSNSFASLNTDPTLLATVVNAINTAKGTTITSSDITLINNKSSNQTAGAVITFIVAANPTSSQVTGSFQFTDTLGKVDISTGVVINDLATPVSPTDTYTSLNTNSAITTAVANAINTAKGTNVTTNDFTITNNQTGGQVPNTIITFTVTANANSLQIQGSFNFINTLGRASINSGITTYDPAIGYDPVATYAALNTNTYLLNLVASWIQNAKNVFVIPGTDFTLSNNQSQSTLQTLGTAVTLTATATTNGKLTGSFSFTDTLTRANISYGVYLPDFRVPATSATTYAGLNSASAIVNVVTNAINNSKMTNAIVGTDFTLTNNQTAGATPVAGTVVTFTITGAGKLTATMQFNVTLI